MFLPHVYMIRNKKTQEERRVFADPGGVIAIYKNEYICWQTMYNELRAKYESVLADARRRS